MTLDNRLKIANILEESRYGGPQARVVSIARKLKQHGIDTIVIYSKNGSDVLIEKLHEGDINGKSINMTRLSNEKKVLLRYIFRFIPELLLLYSEFKHDRFDLIHVNGSSQMKGAIAGRLAGIPVIWHFNDTNMMPLIKRISYIAAKYCASGFIVTSGKTFDYYIRNTKLETRPYMEIQAPVDTKAFDPSIVEADPEINSAEGIKILMVANINPGKGYGHFIDTVAELNKCYKNLHFFIAGPVYSSQKRYYRTLLKRIDKSNIANITFMGGSKCIKSLLKAADIYFYTSLYEAGPMSIWEAMSMAKPIVTTDVGSVNSFIRDGENGFVVRVGDVRMMAEKIGILIRDENKRNYFGEKARQTAVWHLDVEICAVKHREFYEKVAKNKIYSV